MALGNCCVPLRQDWGWIVIELVCLLVMSVAVVGLALYAVIPTRGSVPMAVAPARPDLKTCDSWLPFCPVSIPPDATHIAWIMCGARSEEVVYSLRLEDIQSVKSQAMLGGWNLFVLRSIELEDDLRSREAFPATDIRYAIARCTGTGEKWWSGSRWVSRWHRTAGVFDAFGSKA